MEAFSDESHRKLATKERVESIRPIPDADSIEVARVRGWDVVVAKGRFRQGDPCIYIEIDSFLPVDRAAFAFLEPRGLKTDESGNQGHVLKTVRLRGQVSQGLLITMDEYVASGGHPNPIDGSDVSTLLGITKWDPPLPATLAGQVKGVFPRTLARKTDAERVQNLSSLFEIDFTSLEWEATEKIDGSSVTYILFDDEFRVCSRNLELRRTEGNSLWGLAEKYDIEGYLRSFGHPHVVLQGEIYGPGINANRLRVKVVSFASFYGALLDGSDEQPLPDSDHPVASLTVPLLDLRFPGSVDEAVAQANGLKSAIAPDRMAEGVVWNIKGHPLFKINGDYHRCFKAINNEYLLKDKS